ncbi:MAG: radical SAM protein, partial [Nitrososphaerota archaeon]
ALGSLIRNMIMIGCMHFMDHNNFDLARVQRCVIHYALPNGSIIPFCTLNSLHRYPIEKEYSMSIEEWHKIHPNAKLNDYV